MNNPLSNSQSPEVPSITYTRGLGTYFKKPVEGNQHWQFFNPISRDWHFVNRSQGETGGYLIFRNGWIVRRLGRRDRGHDYYLCEFDALQSKSRSEAEVLAYECSPGWMDLDFALRDGRLFLHMGGRYFPWQHFSALRALSEHMAERDGSIEVISFSPERKIAIERILHCLRFRIVPSKDFVPPPPALKPEEKAVYKALLKRISEIFKLAYGDYLKREDRIEEFILDIVHRRWDRIPSEQLREQVEGLTRFDEQGNRLASRLLEFILDKLPIYFDWRDIGQDPRIEGTIIDGTPLEFENRWATNYYKVIVPDLEAAVYWQTTLAPTDKGTGAVISLASRLLGVTMAKWRLYPYLGKLRLTGSRDDVRFGEQEPREIRRAFSSILGIPSFELILRELAYVDGYNLDYKEWRGGYNFNRYYQALVRIERTLQLESATPTTLVADIFGNHFAIQWDVDNYLHESEVIHRFSPGGWLSVLLVNELNAIDPDYQLPTFPVAPRIGPRFVTKADAYKENVLGIVRYCGFISGAGLRYLRQHVVDPTEFDRGFGSLRDGERLVEANDFWFYVHNCVAPNMAQLLATAMVDPNRIVPARVLREDWYQKWSMLRASFPYLHPLVQASGLFNAPLREPFPDDAKHYESLRAFVDAEISIHDDLRKRVLRERLTFLVNTRRTGLTFFDTLVGDREEERYGDHASLMLRNFGYARIKARGRWIMKAHAVTQRVARFHAYALPQVTRHDTLERTPGGRVIPSVEFDIQTFATRSE